ncbi:hypothetical protein [Marivita sp.]|uniref:hypothetical protein n=1 Tax=Marivita sp. TaxID=2003365 RepID=UPI003F6F5D20
MMENWIDWVTSPGNVLTLAQLVATVIIAFATIALWRVTRVLADETSVLAKMTSQPFVVCALESSEVSAHALNLKLKNSGNGTAFDIKLKVSPPLPKADGTPKDGENMERSVSLLPPGSELAMQVVMGRDVHDTVFSAEVSWAHLPGSSEREVLKYTFSALDGFRGGAVSKGPHHIAEELEKIRKHVEKG